MKRLAIVIALSGIICSLNGCAVYARPYDNVGVSYSYGYAPYGGYSYGTYGVYGGYGYSPRYYGHYGYRPPSYYGYRYSPRYYGGGWKGYSRPGYGWRSPGWQGHGVGGARAYRGTAGAEVQGVVGEDEVH